jgi:hypothetical protein
MYVRVSQTPINLLTECVSITYASQEGRSSMELSREGGECKVKIYVAGCFTLSLFILTAHFILQIY